MIPNHPSFNPQVSSSKRWCGNAKVPGSVPALFGRGAYSEMFLLSAFATVSAVADALGSARPRQMAGLRTTLCNTQRPVCMDALVYSDPRHPGPASQAATLGIKSAWKYEPNQTVTLCRRWAKTAATLAGVEGGSAGPAARTATTMLPVTPRKVVLLTRRTQSVWTNRAEAAVQLRALVHTRGGTFLDAGNAEDLGVQEQRGRCYLARPQVELWRRGAFAVVSPVGAHLTNLVFMQGALGGLVQSNNCGFATETYEILARACGVRFAASYETQRKGARCPVPPRGQVGFNAVMLDSPRTMQIERADTLGAVVRSMMRVSLGVCPAGDAACKPARGTNWKERRASAFLRTSEFLRARRAKRARRACRAGQSSSLRAPTPSRPSRSTGCLRWPSPGPGHAQTPRRWSGSRSKPPGPTLAHSSPL